MSFTGSDLLTTRHMGNSTASASGVRLLTRSAGKFFASTGATLRAAAVPSNRVVPAGSARAAVTAAKAPPPPGRLSMITGSLVDAVNASPTAWPIMSAAPPAASGVTILTGRVGQSCARAPERPATSNATAKSPPPAPRNPCMHLPRTTFARHPQVKPGNDAGSIANSCAGHTFAERRRAFSEIDYPLDPGQYSARSLDQALH